MSTPAVMQNCGEGQDCAAHGRKHSGHNGDIIGSKVLGEAQSGIRPKSDEDNHKGNKDHCQDQDRRAAHLRGVGVVSLRPCDEDIYRRQLHLGRLEGF